MGDDRDGVYLPTLCGVRGPAVIDPIVEDVTIDDAVPLKIRQRDADRLSARELRGALVCVINPDMSVDLISCAPAPLCSPLVLGTKA
jgi:hypothetical protein